MAARAMLLVALVLAALPGLATADPMGLAEEVPRLPVIVPERPPLPPATSSPGLGDPRGGDAMPGPPSAPDLMAPDGSWTSGIAAAGVLGAAALGALLVWGGTRFRTEDVLEHEVRAGIYRHVQGHVGASLKEITDTLGLSTTNAVWHLRKLEESGLVRGRKFNGAKVYYPTAGGVQARNLSIAGAALASDNARQILSFVRDHPGVHQREVGRLLNVNHGTVRWHLKKLRKAELLEERRLGGTASYHCTTLGAEALRVVEARTAPLAAPAPLASTALPSEPGRA